MVFSRVVRSLSSSSRPRSTLYRSGGRSAGLNGGLLQTPRLGDGLSGLDGKLEFLREFLVSVRPHKEFAAKTCLSYVNHILANPDWQFTGFSPLKPWIRTMRTSVQRDSGEIPKGNDQKSEPKGHSYSYVRLAQRLFITTGLSDSLSCFLLPGLQQIGFQKFKNMLLEPGLVDHVVASNTSYFLDPGLANSYVMLAQVMFILTGLPACLFCVLLRGVQEITFEDFKDKLLVPGLVERVVVSNKKYFPIPILVGHVSSSESFVLVYLEDSLVNQTNNDVSEVPRSGNSAMWRIKPFQYYFRIASEEHFVEKLEEAQEALGIHPYDYVPVYYAYVIHSYQEAMKLALRRVSLAFLIPYVAWKFEVLVRSI